MLVETFVSGDSLVHRLDPRVKIVAACLFSAMVAVADRLLCLAAALAMALLLIFLARLSLQQVLQRLAAVNTLVLLLWLFLPFTYGGEPLFALGPLVASRQGVAYALLITVKSNTIVLALIGLLATSTMVTLGHAMSHLRVPDKLVHLFFFTFRYIQVIYLEYQRLRSAMRVRAFRPATDLHTYRSYAYLVGMLLIKSFDRAERVRKAMLCRGFHGKFYLLSHFEMRGRDVLAFVIMISAITWLAVLQWGIPK